MRKTTRVLGMMIVALAGLFSSAVLAAQLFPDQESLVTLSAGWSAVYLAPMGQEFVPQRSSLDAVELTLANTDTSWPFPADVEVNIRADSITGPLLGTSLRITLPFGSSGVANRSGALPVRRARPPWLRTVPTTSRSRWARRWPKIKVTGSWNGDARSEGMKTAETANRRGRSAAGPC